jgi:hypothetical protein
MIRQQRIGELSCNGRRGKILQNLQFAVSESTGWAGGVYVGGQFATGATPYGPYASAGAGFGGGIIGFTLGKEVGNAVMNRATAVKQGMAQYNEESKKEGYNSRQLEFR